MVGAGRECPFDGRIYYRSEALNECNPRSLIALSKFADGNFHFDRVNNSCFQGDKEAGIGEIGGNRVGMISDDIDRRWITASDPLEGGLARKGAGDMTGLTSFR